ncbi:MAG: hypothetical protein GY854_30865 [Deltaproteobacteria bacterium]|nr:hypothetical protein [Deltaproteobacteria bacterium]
MNANRKLTATVTAALAFVFLATPAGAFENDETPAEDPGTLPKGINDLEISKIPSDRDAGPEAPPVEDAWPHIAGEWPKKTRKVSVTVTDETIASVLQSISKQLGYGLVLNAPEALIHGKATLRLVRKPAKDVLEIVLKNANLQAELVGDILFVEPAKPSSPAAGIQHPPLASSFGSPSSIAKGQGVGGHKKRGRRGKHIRDRVQIGKSIRIEADEEVGDAVVVGGSLTVAGRVLGDAVGVGGSVTIEPSAYVQGDAVSVGGTLNVSPDATVQGEQVGVGIPIPLVGLLKEGKDFNWSTSFPAILSGVAGTFAAFTIIGVLLRSVLIFVLALVIVALMPKRVERVRDYLTSCPGYSMLGGGAIMLLFVPLIIILAITLIGIPLIPVVIIAMAVMVVVGLTALLIWFGYKIPLFKQNKTQLGALAIGIVVFMVINLIPFLGQVVITLAAFTAAGAVLLSRFGAEPNA